VPGRQRGEEPNHRKVHGTSIRALPHQNYRREGTEKSVDQQVEVEGDLRDVQKLTFVKMLSNRAVATRESLYSRLWDDLFEHSIGSPFLWPLFLGRGSGRGSKWRSGARH